MKRISGLLVVALFTTSFAIAQEKLDSAAINKIKREGLDNSKVMDIAFQLTDVSGPRLTNSPGFLKAANWAKTELEKWGLVNAALEPWGEFGKSWELQKSYIAMTTPYYRPLIAYPKTWTNGSGSLKRQNVIVIKAKDSAELEQYHGKITGMIVMLDRTDTLKPSYQPDANRYDDARLEKMANAKPVLPRTANDTAAERRRRQFGNQPAFGRQWRNFIAKENPLAVLSTNPNGRDGTLFVSSGGSYAATDPVIPLDMMIAYEDYMSILRLVKSGYPVQLEVDVEVEYSTKDLKGYNVIAEIKGTDPKLKNELVMLGGHLDSWQSSTGATDNAAGCAVMMEAIRILKQTGLQPRRTIRIALWSGEEQGLLGSRGYVKEHFGDVTTMTLKPDQAKISAYFNLDNGSGKIRGIYTQGNEAVMPVFTQWLTPFNDLGAKTVTVSNTGGTDHQSFDRIGIPGFQFIQDELEYNTRTHHTNMDSYDHLSAADLKQAATIVAAFVYNAANRDEKLPRKELPKPRP